MTEPRHLTTLVTNFENARVMVFGEVMLDRSVYGKVERISPEAPVPVLSVCYESVMLGGTGNVARNIIVLGGCVVLGSLVGDDRVGEQCVNV